MSERGQIFRDIPEDPNHGESRIWRRVIQGKQYSFTAVTMPSGELRYFVSRFNGYAGGPRFACAWDRVLEWTFKPRGDMH
jgi:hypothetical protein